MIFGLLQFSWWQYVIAALAVTHITIVGVTIFLHRHQAHRALELHPLISHFFRFWLWLTTGMVTKEWVAIHRKHHAHTESENDPHSPMIEGINKVLWEGVELYRAESRNQETMDKYGFGTPDDWLERTLYTPYHKKGVIVLLFINLLLFGIPGVSIWAIQMMWIPFFAAGVVNGIGHYWGYRNFEVADASTNIVPWGIIIGGEELHNNHHTYPTSAKLSVKWWEFDIGWMYIRLLSFIGLAKVKRVPPKLAIAPNKGAVDIDTVKAVISNRFQIMSRYAKDVIAPVLRQEKSQSADGDSTLFQHAKKLLVAEKSLLQPESIEQLNKLLADKERLNLVYEFRLKLQELWERTSASQKELLESLQQWCKQAEATGIESLENFSMKLKSFIPSSV